MNTMKKRLLTAALILGIMPVLAYDYNVRMPSTAACPRWRGAKVGEWTMDYEAARSQAIAEGRGMILFTTGSWWCPHCEAFEEKVLLDHAAALIVGVICHSEALDQLAVITEKCNFIARGADVVRQ